MDTVELLTQSRALIEKGWCQNTNARSAKNRPVSASSPKAVNFCALGAITAVWLKSSNSTSSFNEAMRALNFVVGGHVPTWNDMPERTQDEVLAAYDCAIGNLTNSPQ